MRFLASAHWLYYVHWLYDSTFWLLCIGWYTVAQKYILVDQSGRLSCYPHKRSMVSGGSAECRVTELIQPLTYLFPEWIRRPRGDVGGNRSASPAPIYDAELRGLVCMVGRISSPVCAASCKK